jgi:hypothetical protein
MTIAPISFFKAVSMRSHRFPGHDMKFVPEVTASEGGLATIHICSSSYFAHCPIKDVITPRNALFYADQLLTSSAARWPNFLSHF